MRGFNPDFRLVTALRFQSVIPHTHNIFEDLQVYFTREIRHSRLLHNKYCSCQLANLRYAICLLTPVLGWSASAAQVNVFIAARLVTSCLQDLRCQCVPETSWYPESSHADVHF